MLLETINLSFNPLPNNKILRLVQIESIDFVLQTTINASQKLKFVLRRVEKIVGKGENAGCQKTSLSRSLKVSIV